MISIAAGAKHVSSAHGNATAYSIGTYFIIGMVCAFALFKIYKNFDRIMNFLFHRNLNK